MPRSLPCLLSLSALFILSACTTGGSVNENGQGLNEITAQGAAPLAVSGHYIRFPIDTPSTGTGIFAESLLTISQADAPVSGALSGQWTRPTSADTSGSIAFDSSNEAFNTPLDDYSGSAILGSSYDYVRVYHLAYQDSQPDEYFSVRALFGTLAGSALPETGTATYSGSASMHIDLALDTAQHYNYNSVSARDTAVIAYFAAGTYGGETIDRPSVSVIMENFSVSPNTDNVTLTAIHISNLAINRGQRSFSADDDTVFSVEAQRPAQGDAEEDPVDLFIAPDANRSTAQGFFFGDSSAEATESAPPDEVGGYFNIAGLDGHIAGFFVAD